MKLYQKLISLLVAAVMAAVLMPVCMAAPGDSVETRVNNALAQRTGAELYQEIVTTAPDGTTQTMIAARSNGNAYIKMDMGDAGSLVVYPGKTVRAIWWTMHPGWPSRAKYPL